MSKRKITVATIREFYDKQDWLLIASSVNGFDSKYLYGTKNRDFMVCGNHYKQVYMGSSPTIAVEAYNKLP